VVGIHLVVLLVVSVVVVLPYLEVKNYLQLFLIQRWVVGAHLVVLLLVSVVVVVV
jgi:hypothetical protein